VTRPVVASTIVPTGICWPRPSSRNRSCRPERPYPFRVRCYVEPSPSGGYFVRLRGEAAPLSRHDTEEEAELAAAAYDRGLARDDTAEHVLLSDGSEVLIRTVRPEDKPLFVAGWSHLSDESVYRRFLQLRDDLSVDELAFFTEIDHVDHEAIGAMDGETREGVAVARYVRDRERPHVAEAAVVVIDAWQARGLGGKLLRRLCARATENRIRVFSASLLSSNDAMLTLFERLGEVKVTRRDGAVMEIDVELPLALPTLEHTLREAAAGHVHPRPRPRP
jgi:GNAT superfamily N-acetyltransferase